MRCWVFPATRRPKTSSAHTRERARELHPDVNDDPSAGERMKRANAAHHVLADETRRKQYDEQRNSGTDTSDGGCGSENLSGPIFPAPTAPLDVARQLYVQYTLDGLRTLLAWRGGFLQWHTTDWREMDTAGLRSVIYSTLEHATFWHPIGERHDGRLRAPAVKSDRHKIVNVLEALSAVGHLSSDIDAPAWIGETPTPPAAADAAQTISCENGLLDLHSRRLTEHAPSLFNFVSVPFKYD
jgi:hypothetical protein